MRSHSPFRGLWGWISAPKGAHPDRLGTCHHAEKVVIRIFHQFTLFRLLSCRKISVSRPFCPLSSRKVGLRAEGVLFCGETFGSYLSRCWFVVFCAVSGPAVYPPPCEGQRRVRLPPRRGFQSACSRMAGLLAPAAPRPSGGRGWGPFYSTGRTSRTDFPYSREALNAVNSSLVLALILRA